MKLVDMAMTAQDMAPQSSSEDSGENYPMGLCIYISEEQIKKLGITKMPNVGDIMKIEALAEVCCTNVSEDDNGERRSINFQIEQMAIAGTGKTDKQEDSAKAIYGE